MSPGEDIADTSYVTLDDNICQTPVRLLPTVSASQDATGSTSPQTFLAMTVPADAGSCALSTIVDAENSDLYVAIAGDCRAVAGWEKDGTWRCDVLTDDQMGENPKEVAR